MGFYDNNQSYNRRPPTILIAIISAIVGGLIVGVILTPIFLMKGTFFNDEKQSTSLTEQTGQTKTTTVKVNTNITQAVKTAGGAVVGIINLQHSNNPFESSEVKQGTGSGIIFEKVNGKARVVTNNHVIAGGNEIQVVLPDQNGKSQPERAKVLGHDEVTDLAVLEIDASHVKTVAQFGNSTSLQSGEPAIAIGNPLGLESSTTVGVISSPKRSINLTEDISTDVIQTDAAINPGNSGGALVNSAGQVIGINSLKIAESGVEGLGFAIPINDAIPIIRNLITKGEVPRPYFGIRLVDLQDLPIETRTQDLGLPQNMIDGTVIASDKIERPAAIAGLQFKDVIVKLDNQSIKSRSELRRYIYKYKKPNDKVTVSFYRNGQLKTTTVQLTKAPNFQLNQ
ncbi:serine protease Do [Seinonella peptonophila]|uniref:Serine protease Do n=1 Tax=Seinonella peptonophila TaxID=112248 RepID=A0A1M4WXB1_9BACL|nr:trypsin-like peptidase domain-containing protein [Seinonella peptonophila]SHE85830.1 serine protease Do [Seinonella peptonophila]